MLRWPIVLGAAATIAVLLAGCGGGGEAVTVTAPTPTVTVTETATVAEPDTGATTETVPPEETTTEEAAPGFVDPCDYVSASDIEKAVGGSFKKGVSSEPAEGVGACLFKASSGSNFVGILTFESARAFPGGWKRLSKDSWTESDYAPLWDILGVDEPDQGDPGWASYGCSMAIPGNRTEAFAMLLFVLDHSLSEDEIQEVWDLLDEVQTACVAV
jgi:hypothetical protein